MGKKDLDKLFQEKLKDFSEVPDDNVWQSIEASLNKKNKPRRVIPIWWKLGGVAAILLIAITIFNPFTDRASISPAVTDVNDDSEKMFEESKTDKTFENQNSNENQIVVEQETISDINENSTNQVANTNPTSKDSKSNTEQKTSTQKLIKNQNALANSNVLEVKKDIEQNGTIASENSFDRINQETVIAETPSTHMELGQKDSLKNSKVKDNRFLNEIENSSKEGIAENIKEEFKEDIEEANKKSILDAITEQEQATEAITETTESKWSAGPSIAPVYFDAIGEGSPVHSIFVPNSKSGNVNLSYGLSVAYEVTKKLSIRSGVHKVDYGYRTNDVEFSSSLESATNSQIDNIDYTLTSKNLVVSSKASTRIEALNQNPFLDTSSDVSAASAARDGVMEQQFGYLEVPIELNYSLLNSRFGINLIGGVSSLFLVDNSISLSSGELTTEVGEANNVNSVNFSTNVGFGMNYKVTPKVQLNIEPVFKYQLNTFSETDGTFNPFSVGVYSGMSFRF